MVSHASNRLRTVKLRLARLSFGGWTFPLVVAGLFLLCFGLFLPEQGFFWDDWTQLLSRHLFGYAAYMRYFYERPLSGWTHIVFGPLMGDFPLRWQVFTLALRAATVPAAWWMFRLVWPARRRDAALAALLFGLYPGFTQQPVSVAYHQHWLQYLLFLLSLAFMLKAIRAPQRGWAWTCAALVCQLLQFSITEFLVGVELMRPLLLWAALGNGPESLVSGRKRLAATLRAWAPYLAVLLGYGVWRGFFLRLPDGRNSPALLSALAADPLATVLRTARYAATDALNTLINVWGKVFDLRLGDFRQPAILFSWLASAITAVGLGLYLANLRPGPNEAERAQPRRGLEWIGLGLLGAILGPLPLWLTDQDILYGLANDPYHVDRFTLAAMLWAGLLLAGVLIWAVERWKTRAILTAVLVGLLVGFQARTANDYRWLSVDQARFYWQLAWRAPSLKPRTTLLSEQILFPYQGLFSTSSAVNLLYPQTPNPERVNYWVYALNPRFTQTDPLESPVSFNTTVRLLHFQGRTPNSLVLAYDAPRANCLWMLRPEDADLPDLSDTVRRWLPVSNLARIQPDTQQPPSPALFGPEPEHGWCYLFEKADLARQQGDWSAAAALGDQARALGYAPDRPGSNSAYEWQPFVQAYAQRARWQDAADLTLASAAYDPADAPFLCGRWQKLLNTLPEGGERARAGQQVQAALNCGPNLSSKARQTTLKTRKELYSWCAIRSACPSSTT